MEEQSVTETIKKYDELCSKSNDNSSDEDFDIDNYENLNTSKSDEYINSSYESSVMEKEHSTIQKPPKSPSVTDSVTINEAYCEYSTKCKISTFNSNNNVETTRFLAEELNVCIHCLVFNEINWCS